MNQPVSPTRAKLIDAFDSATSATGELALILETGRGLTGAAIARITGRIQRALSLLDEVPRVPVDTQPTKPRRHRQALPP